MANPFRELFDKQQEVQFKIGQTTYKQRISKLNRLKIALEKTFRHELKQALYDDFRKPFLETDLTDIYPVISDIKYVKKHLKIWMKKKRVKTPMALMGTSSWIHYEPKGVCLIISPWNFPINLTFGPLVSAIAAGNTVILKPSEMTPNTSRVMRKIVSEIFEENEVALIEGEVEVSKTLLELPFHHIFFTGSPAVGKLVMEAASKNLTSLTLELGGKSPTIVDDTANIKLTAKRIAWGKFVNSGQICVAPDYVMVHEAVKTEFIHELITQIESFYGKDVLDSSDYGGIVNVRHFERLKSLIEHAKDHGAKIEYGGLNSEVKHRIHPTILSQVSDDSKIMNEEIFGPILPIKTFQNLSEVVHLINSKERPLALYMYSKNRKHTQYVINNTRAGSTAINTNVLQYSNHYLPFGGINHSGIGKSHGYFGFEAFSNQRSVMKQYHRGAMGFLFPPYNNWKEKLVDLTIKWL